MQKRRLGRTNLGVSAIGFGGIPIQKVGEKEAVYIVQTAIGLGINFFDTSNDSTYGDSELKIGRGVANHRDKVVIATKTKRLQYNDVQASIENSLRRMGTDFIDVYMFHNVKNISHLSKDGAIDAVLRAQEQGKIRFIGMSSHDDHIIEAAINHGLFDVVEYIFNPVRQSHDVVRLAQANDIGFVAMKPLAGGNILRADLSLRWILEHPISSAIPGVSSMEELQRNASVGRDYMPLDTGEQRELESIVVNLKGQICLACGYCLPCRDGIQIPTILYLYNYATKMGLDQQALARFKNEVKVNPADCTKCGECEPKCPEGIAIRDRLKIASDYFRENQI